MNENGNKIQPSLVGKFFLENSRFTYLIILGILTLGFLAIYTIPKESAPEVKIPFAIVSNVYPGASALDVEELVTDVLEDKILGLTGLETVTSTSSEGFSSIFVEFSADEDLEQSIRDLKDKVDAAKVELPNDANDVVVTEVSLDNEPIIVLTLSGPYSTRQLKQFAEDLSDDIKRISKVSEVEIFGGEEREIQVVVNKQKLDLYNLSLGQISQAIGANDANIPVGDIQTNGSKYNIRLKADIQAPEEIEMLPIATFNGATIFVKDVADVFNGYKKATSNSSVSIGGEKKGAAITLQIKKETGGNIMRLSDSVRALTKKYEEEIFPLGVNVDYTMDLSTYIERDLVDLTKNGLTTVLLVFIVIFLFLGWKESIVASMAIPFTFLTTFFVLSAIGYTLNFMTLFSLILSLGILVDTTIVMTESIHKKYKSTQNIKSACLNSLSEYKWPLTSGTLTTVAAFVPLLFMSGMMGAYVRSIPVTVTIVLLSSLLVALFIVPTIATTAFANSKAFITKIGMILFFVALGLFITDQYKYIFGGGILIAALYIYSRLGFTLGEFVKRSEQMYHDTLKDLLESWLNKLILSTVVIVLFIASVSLIPLGYLKVVMFEEVDQDLFRIALTMPTGTPIENTMLVANDIADVLYEYEDIKSFTLSVGGSRSGNSHKASFVVTLPDPKERNIRSLELQEQIREEVKKIRHQGRIKISQDGAGPPSAAPVVIKFKGNELDVLERLALEMKEVLKNIPGTTEVDLGVDEPGTEFVFKLNKDKTSYYNISPMQVAQELRGAVYGINAATIQYEGEDIDVVVKLALNHLADKNDDINKTTIDSLESLLISTPQGNVSLNTITDIFLASSQTAINHEDGDRIINVTSYLQQGFSAPEIFEQAQVYIDEMNIPVGYTVQMGGENEAIQESFADLFKALIIGLLLISSILILQFNSFRQPLFIIMTLPLSFIGVLPGLTLMGLALSFPAFFGIIALAGVVVNNAIILIDRINFNRKVEKLDIKESILESATSRLQPIVLTTITTIIGIFPLAISQEIWGGLGFSMIFGLLVSTVLTLFVIPMVYYKFGEKKLD